MPASPNLLQQQIQDPEAPCAQPDRVGIGPQHEVELRSLTPSRTVLP